MCMILEEAAKMKKQATELFNMGYCAEGLALDALADTFTNAEAKRIIDSAAKEIAVRNY